LEYFHSKGQGAVVANSLSPALGFGLHFHEHSFSGIQHNISHNFFESKQCCRLDNV